MIELDPVIIENATIIVCSIAAIVGLITRTEDESMACISKTLEEEFTKPLETFPCPSTVFVNRFEAVYEDPRIVGLSDDLKHSLSKHKVKEEDRVALPKVELPMAFFTSPCGTTYHSTDGKYLQEVEASVTPEQYRLSEMKKGLYGYVEPDSGCPPLTMPSDTKEEQIDYDNMIGYGVKSCLVIERKVGVIEDAFNNMADTMYSVFNPIVSIISGISVLPMCMLLIVRGEFAEATVEYMQAIGMTYD